MSNGKPNPKAIRQIIDARKPKNPPGVVESPSIITSYFRDINKIVRQMAQLVKERIYPILDQYAVRPAQTASGQRGLQVTDDDFGLALNAAFAGLEKEFETLNRYAARVATNRFTQANHANRRAFVRQWSQTVGVDVTPLLSPSVMVGGRLIDKDTVGPVSRAVTTNVELIETVPKKHLAGIQKVILDGIANGDDSFSLKKAIEKVNGQDTRRAKLIARDQLQKLNGVLNQARQQSIGVSGYVWRTSHDERVRDSHRDNDGKTFQWDAPPRETGHPGEDINCRCVAEPDLTQIVPWLKPTLEPGPRPVAKKKRRVVKKKTKAAVKKKKVESKTVLTQRDLDKSREATAKAQKTLKAQQAKTARVRKALKAQEKKASDAAKKVSEQQATVKAMESKIKKLKAETKQIDSELAREDRTRKDLSLN